MSRSRTTLTIAHRLSTVKNSDRVVVLMDGKVAEQGPFTELANKENSLFRKLILHQLVN